MEFQFQDVKPGFASPDYLFNFEQAGQISPTIKPPSTPNSLDSLAADYILRQRQVADAIAQQHKIDNIYERIMGTAPTRDVEVLPPENPAEAFNPNRTRLKNITPVEQQQEISNLLERQLKRPTTPPPATPPQTVTPRTFPLADPMATPPTAIPRQPINSPNPVATAKPSSLPVSAGRLGLKAVGTVADFGFRLAAGQSVEQAAVGTAGSAVGSYIGGAFGSALGPLGTFGGAVIGSYIGGAIADYIFEKSQPKPAEITQDLTYYTYPFYGGQSSGVQYQILYAFPNIGSADFQSVTAPIPGKITDFRYAARSDLSWRAEFYYANGTQVAVNDGAGSVLAGPPYIIRIFRADGQPDTGGNPPSIPPPPDRRTPESTGHPGNSEYSVPRGFPGARETNAPNNYVPGSVTPKASPRGDTRNWIPHAGLAPRQNPNPTQTPSGLGGGFPRTSPNLLPTPGTPGEPSKGPNPSPPSYRLYGPSARPVPPTSNPQLAPPNSTPSPLPNYSPYTPPADGLKPGPEPDPNPTPTPTPSPDPNPQTDICESPCIKSMGEQISQSKIFWIDLEVPIVLCVADENGVLQPKRENKTVKVIATSEGNEVIKVQTEFKELAKINEELCLAKSKEDAYLVTPEWWQVRSFQRPQLVIQYAELLPNNKVGRSRWSTSIPHYNKSKDYKPKFPQYEKGNFEGILILNDNSKIIINAKTKPECARVLENFKIFINPDYLKDIKLPKIGERPGVYKQVSVVPVYAHFFQDGQKDNVPTWSIKLRDKK